MSPRNVKPSTSSDNRDGGASASRKTSSDEQMVSRVLGGFFVVVGLTLVALLIVMFIISRLPYRKDPNMPIPTLEEIDEYTNDDEIDIKGEVIPGEKVALYQDGKLLDDRVEADDSGEFEFKDIDLDEEGETKFEAVTVRGRIFKKRSEKSNSVETEVDRTKPSSKVSLEYDENASSDEVTIKGEAEKDSSVILKNDDNEYETKTDKDGNFEISGVKLEDGENEYEVRVKDKAGNEVKSSTKVKINRNGDVNGDGATSATGTSGGKLPESAGELDKAIEFLLGNKIMFVIGLAALLVFGASSTGVYFYNKRK